MSDQRNHSSDGRASSDGSYLSAPVSTGGALENTSLNSSEGSSTAGLFSSLMRAASAPSSAPHLCPASAPSVGIHDSVGIQLAPSRLGSRRYNEPTSMQPQPLGRTVQNFTPASNKFQQGVSQLPLSNSQSARLNYDAPPYQSAPTMGISVGSLTASQLAQHRQQAAISGIRQRLAQATLGSASVSTGPRRSTVATVSASSLNQLQGHQNLGYPQHNPFAFSPPPIPQPIPQPQSMQGSYSSGPPNLQHMNMPGVGTFAPSHLTSNQMMQTPFVGQASQLTPTSMSPQLLAYIGSELARSGVTVASAIESGILGPNLSRDDVEMIVDAHVAEQAKMAPLLVEGHASILSGNVNAFPGALGMNQGALSSQLGRQQAKPFEAPNFGRGSHDSALSGASGETFYGDSSCGEMRDSQPAPQSGPLLSAQMQLFQRRSYPNN